MRPNPMAPVWARLDDEPPVFHADRAAAEFPPGGWDRALGLGLLRELPPSNSAACRECGGGYANRVAFLPDPAGGARPYLRCPGCGPVRVDPADLRRWAVDAPAVAAAVLRLAGGSGTPAEVVAGRLWHLGRVRLGGRPRDAYLARGVYAGGRAEVAAALAARPVAVLFVPTEAAAARWGGATANPVVALEAAVALGPEGLTFDPTAVEARLPEAGRAARNRPAPKRGVREAAIAKLTAELREHHRAARDHAYSTLALAGEAKLLPRPSQQQLADRTGLSKWVVSRCLGDRSASVLKHLWVAALHLDQVMAGPPPG